MYGLLFLTTDWTGDLLTGLALILQAVKLYLAERDIDVKQIEIRNSGKS